MFKKVTQNDNKWHHLATGCPKADPGGPQEPSGVPPLVVVWTKPTWMRWISVDLLGACRQIWTDLEDLGGSGWIWMDLDGSGWIWVDLSGSGWIWVDLGGSERIWVDLGSG